MDQDRLSARARRIASSAIWAAWADAVGFISELTDESGLRRRLAGTDLLGPVTWRRRVGGRTGVAAELPAGTYSDDTQLRLAVARAISGAGFDVEAFARVELTVWPAYALGGGRASRAAAANMARPQAGWYANYFNGWVNAGGNGAAMRIQPHVWAATDLVSGSYVADVVRDSIVTHGHPRALVGAVAQSIALAHALSSEAPPGPDEWPGILEATRLAVGVFDTDPDLSMFWMAHWQHETGEDFRQAWLLATDELGGMLDQARGVLNKLGVRTDDERAPSNSAIDAYDELAQRLHLRESDVRGSGTATVAAALAVAAAYPDAPRLASLLAAGAVGTDTDTIATMSAGIIAAACEEQPDVDVQDIDHLKAESFRLARVAFGETTKAFSYPDLLHWKPPRTQIDAVRYVDGELALTGLGPVRPISESWSNKDASWTWMITEFQQTLLLRHRPNLLGDAPTGTSRRAGNGRSDFGPTLDDPDLPVRQDVRSLDTLRKTAGIDEMLAWVTAKGLDDKSVGYALKRVAQQFSAEQFISFSDQLRVVLKESR